MVAFSSNRSAATIYPSRSLLGFDLLKAASVFGSVTLSIKLNHLPPFTPCSRAVNIRSVQTVHSTQLHRCQISRLFSPVGHCRRLCFVRSVGHISTFLPPFAPSPLRDFITPMEALTPVRPAAPDWRLELRLFRRTGLPDSRI